MVLPAAAALGRPLPSRPPRSAHLLRRTMLRTARARCCQALRLLADKRPGLGGRLDNGGVGQLFTACRLPSGDGAAVPLRHAVPAICVPPSNSISSSFSSGCLSSSLHRRLPGGRGGIVGRGGRRRAVSQGQTSGGCN